jgi:exosome complex RNA-binding protein Rrp4
VKKENLKCKEFLTIWPIFAYNELLKQDYAVGILGQQNFSIILGAHGLIWIEGIASYFEMQKGVSALD